MVKKKKVAPAALSFAPVRHSAGVNRPLSVLRVAADADLLCPMSALRLATGLAFTVVMANHAYGFATRSLLHGEAAIAAEASAYDRGRGTSSITNLRQKLPPLHPRILLMLE